MRSPFTAFRGERLAGIGHNQGPPLDGAKSWRTFAWKKARKQLMPRLPLEIVKRRVLRAQQLGLEYPQYASILLGTGRDIVGFLFTCDALGMRLSRSLELPHTVEEKLADLTGCERLLITDGNPVTLAQALAAKARIRFRHVARSPAPDCSWSEGRDAVRQALAPLGLPSDAVVMVGTRSQERVWADAAKLAKFLPSEQYF